MTTAKRWARAAALAIAQEGQGLVLSWPASAPAWELEAAEALAGADWQVVRVPPALFAGRLRVRLDLLEATQFFRLRQGSPAAP